MNDVELGLVFDDGGTLDGFTKIQVAAAGLDDALSEVSKTSQNTFTKLADDIKQADKEQQKNIETIGKQITATAESDRQNRQWGKGVKDATKNITVFGINIGDVTDKLESKRQKLKDSVKGVKNLVGGFGKLKVAIAATGIGLLLVALGALSALFQRNQKAIDFVNQKLAGTGAAIDVIIDRAALIGSAITNLFSGKRAQAANDLKNAFAGVGDELQREVNLAQLLERELQKLASREQILSVQRAKSRLDIKQANLIAENTAKSFNERNAAIKKAMTIEGELLSNRNDLQKQGLALALGQSEFDEKTAAVLEKINGIVLNSSEDLEAYNEVLNSIGFSATTRDQAQDFFNKASEYYEGQNDSIELQTTFQNKQNSLQKEYADRATRAATERNKQLEAERKAVEQLQDEYSRLVEDLDGRLQAAALDQLSGVERIEQEREIAQQQINELEKVAQKRAIELGKSYDLEIKFNELRAATNATFDDERTALEIQAATDRIAATKKEYDEKQQANEAFFNNQIALIEQQKEVELANVEFIEDAANSVLNIEQQKESKRLEIQLDALEKRRAFFVEFYGTDSLEVQLIEAQVKSINGKLSNIGKDFTSVFEKVKNSILKGLNISDEELNFLVENVLSLGSTIADSFKSGVDEAIKEQERLLSAIDIQIDASEDALNREFELKKAGLANSFELEKQNIADLQAQRETAEKKKSKLEAQAAKKTILANSAAQVSELILAGTKVISAHANIPFVGVALGLGFLATIIGTVNKLKAQSKGIKLFTGGRIPLSGKDDRIGEGHKIEGTNIEVGSGEWVINRSASQEHNSFLNALNIGKFRGINLSELAQRAQGNNIVTDAATSIQGLEQTTYKKQKKEQAQRATGATSKDIETLRADQQKGFDKLIKAIARQPDRIPIEGGYYEITKTDNQVTKRKIKIE